MSHRTNRRHKRNLAKLPRCYFCRRVMLSEMQRCNYGITKYCHKEPSA
jgi:hypothetical protein